MASGFFLLTLLLSIHITPFLSYFIHAVPMRECFFSQTLAHRNSKNKIGRRKTEEGKMLESRDMESNKAGKKEKGVPTAYQDPMKIKY